MAERIRNYIGGEWVDPSSNEWAPNINPARTDDVIDEFPLSTASDLDLAVQAAKKVQPEWAKMPAPKRGALLFKAHALMTERADELARALTREEGKVLPEAKGEVQKSLDLLEFIAGEGRRLNGQTVPSQVASTFAYTVRAPLGVVGLITPWNFPVAIPVWKIAPALVTGNTVVLKPAEQTPTTARIVTEIFADAGLPAGVLNTVYGRGESVGARLVDHPDVAAISFTGSTEVGLKAYVEGARKNKKVQCEMGGKNALILLEDGDVDMAVAAAAKGAFGSTGQRCTATSRAVVHEDVHDAFVAGVVEAAKAVKPGDGLEEATSMGPSVDEGQLEQVLRYIEVAKEEGVTLELPGGRFDEGALANGYFPRPTVLTGVTPEMRVAQEEIFGPVLSVIKVSSFEEAIEVANNSEYGLSSSIYTRDVGQVFDYVDDIETGILHVNSPTIGGEAQLPFGGVKNTGVGEREMGPTAIDFYTELKTVYIDYSSQLREGNTY